jgi:hypothetical protein
MLDAACALMVAATALSRQAVAPRGGRIAMSGSLPAPPAPPIAGQGRGYGGDDGFGLLLTEVSAAQRHALLSLWSFQYERDEDPDNLRAAHFQSRWVGDRAPSGWFGMLKGKTLGVFADAERAPEGRTRCSLTRPLRNAHLL